VLGMVVLGMVVLGMAVLVVLVAVVLLVEGVVTGWVQVQGRCRCQGGWRRGMSRSRILILGTFISILRSSQYLISPLPSALLDYLSWELLCPRDGNSAPPG
jgi:uncharacterized membrane protein HdeD (DUF308 family)